MNLHSGALSCHKSLVDDEMQLCIIINLPLAYIHMVIIVCFVHQSNSLSFAYAMCHHSCRTMTFSRNTSQLCVSEDGTVFTLSEAFEKSLESSHFDRLEPVLVK